MSVASKERRLEIIAYALTHSNKKASDHFGVDIETIKRYMRADRHLEVSIPESQLITDFRKQFSDQEIKALTKSKFNIQKELKRPIPKFDGKRFKIGAFSDPHIGSIFTDYNLIDAMFVEFNLQRVDFITVCGDIHEGMSHRQGHIYECSEIGYQNQLEKSTKIFSNTDKPVYMIDGNHDQWFIKSNGAMIVKELCSKLDHLTFLGHDEGSIDLGGAELRLWHGGDGNSYATSYRIQKVIESLTGGDKPNIMFLGHTHKQIYMFERMVHCFSMGSIQKQSKWMRGKRIAAHTGFWIIDIWVNKTGVSKVSSTWYPFYQ